MGLFGRGEPQRKVVVAHLEVGDAYARLRRGATLVDVRSRYEFNTVHIRGARNIQPSQIRADQTGLELDEDIVVICSNGARSDHQANRLAKKGFSRVASVIGGMKAWERAGLPVKRKQAR